MRFSLSSLRFAAVFGLAGSLSAGLIDWTDWTDTGNGPGVATGVITSLGIDVTFTGDISFLQTGTGTNYWTEVTNPYTGSSVVDNAPTASEMVALNVASTNTITFSSPIVDPVLAIVSLGRNNLPVSYAFDQSFTVLSEGRGYWDDGTYSVSGDTLTGYELHAALQFSGAVSSISWESSPNEYWHGITIGAPVPEPSTLLFAITGGILGIFGLRRRR